jgi:hypothetical protein
MNDRSSLVGIPLALLALAGGSACVGADAQQATRAEVVRAGAAPAVDYSARPGKAFFEEQVLPKLFGNGCALCHTPGRGYVRPAVTYRDLLPYLAMGQAADNNVLIYKMANQRSFAPDRPAHIGGQRCASEDAEPCKTLKAWWDVEFGGRP